MLQTALSTTLILILTACCCTKAPFRPHVSYTPPPCTAIQQPSPFPPLSGEEKNTPWGTELTVGIAFGRGCDFYRSITAFKRALILLPEEALDRRLEIEYEILLAYFLAEKYPEVLSTFDCSTLQNHLSPQFPALHDLLLILAESARHVPDQEYACMVLKRLEQLYPQTAEKLKVAAAVESGHMAQAMQQKGAPSYLTTLYWNYKKETKDPQAARLFNTLLPGAGYWYVGQKNTAFTAFVVNALFIFGAYECFHNGYIAPGIILTSLEGGWYFGGINGAERAACQYNAHLYDIYGRKFLDQEKLYPLFQLHYLF